MDFELHPLGLTARTLFCIGRNYAEHARELGNPVPGDPVVFLKPLSALCRSGGTIVLPARSRSVHHEVEVVVALGRGGRNIPESEALDCIAGYAVGIDVTARDLQDELKKKSLPWTIAKGFDTFAPISDFVPAAAAGQGPHRIALSVNGQTRQSGSTDEMLFPIPRLVAFLSTIFTLAPGDLIFTGTPKGVGPLEAGDRLVAQLDERPCLDLTVHRESE